MEWAEKRKASLMKMPTWKIDGAKRQFGRSMETAIAVFCTSSRPSLNEKLFEKFASGFFEEKPRGELPQNKPTTENRKDAEAAKKS